MAWVIHTEESQVAGLCGATVGWAGGVVVAWRPGSEQVLVVWWGCMVGQGSPAEAGVVAVGLTTRGSGFPSTHPPQETGRDW